MATEKNTKQQAPKKTRVIKINTAERWLDNQEVLQMLHISKRTLQNFRSKRIIPYTMLGKKCFYAESAIHEILMKNMRR